MQDSKQNNRVGFYQKSLITDSFYISHEIQKQSSLHNLDPRLVASVIFQESRGNVWTVKFDKEYYNKHLIKKLPNDLEGYTPEHVPDFYTERILRATRWGLMQILGDDARVFGFSKPFTSALLSPSNNIRYGCMILSGLFRKHAKELNIKSLHKKVFIEYNNNKISNYDELVNRWLVNGAYAKILKVEK